MFKVLSLRRLSPRGLEGEVDASLDQMGAGVKTGVFLGAVQQGVVVTHGEQEVSCLETDAATQEDVEGIAVPILAIVVVGITIGEVEAANGKASVEGGTGHHTILEGGTGKCDETDIVGEMILEGDIHGHVEGNFRVVVRSGSTDRNTGDGGTIVFINALEEHIYIETGGNAEIITQTNLIAGAYIEAIGMEVVCGALATVCVLGLLNNVQITGTGNNLCEGLGAQEHQGCCKKGCKNLFHVILIWLYFPAAKLVLFF